MYEALCRPFGTTLDTVHDEGGPPFTQRTWGLEALQGGDENAKSRVKIIVAVDKLQIERHR
jgi:hypothetical protein